MESSTLSLLIALLAFFIGIVALLRTYREPKAQTTDGFNTRPLKLQAFERLVLLCERISLPALISRTAAPDLSAKEMQYMLAENIKQEYDYNASQQIYVSPTAWEAVRNLRDQTLLIVNSIARSLPPDATAHDLNKGLLEAIMAEDNAALHTFTLATLNEEAKKVM